MSGKRIVLLALVAAGIGILLGAWAMYFRAVTVQVAAAQRDVPVQVFGLQGGL
jgi:HlyD family secretion protein